MSYETEILKPIVDKIILVEIDLPVFNNFWINYEAGIWFINLKPGDTTVTGSDGLVGYYAGQNEVDYNIKSLKVDTEFYTPVSTIADLRTTNKSFFFDFGIQTLYVHFDLFSYPWSYTIKLGSVSGYCDKVDPERGAYYSDVYYEPRITSTPSLSKKKDPLFFGTLDFQGGTVEFANSDGGMDDLIDQDIFGQPLRILLGFTGFDYGDFEQIFSGYVEEPGRDFSKYTITIRDPRKRLSRKIPVNLFNLTDYPDLGADDIDKPVPLAFGVIRGAPVLPYNRQDGTGPYFYKFMDTTDYPAQALTTVYVDNVPVTPASTDLANGEFSLTAGQCKDGSSFLDVKCDITGASIDNGLNVIRYINEEWGDTAFVDTVYDISEWTYEESKADDIGKYIYEREEIIEIIEQVCESLHGIFYPQDSGLFSFRSYRSDRAITKTILTDEWLSEPDISNPSEEYLTTATIRYSEDIFDGETRKFINDDFESTVWAKFGIYRDREFNTLLTNETDASGLSDKIMERSVDIEQEVERETFLQNFDLEIMDFIICEHDRYSVVSDFDRNWGVYEITGINKTPANGKTKLTMRKISDYTWTETVYVQGAPYFIAAYGYHPYGPTIYQEVTE